MLRDAWYLTRGGYPRSGWGKENLKLVRDCGWTFLTQVRCNRRVNPDRSGNRPIQDCDISASGTVVHLEGVGLVKAFRPPCTAGSRLPAQKEFATNGDTEYWITNDLSMGEETRLGYAEQSWGIEEYHRGLKQHCGVDRSAVRYTRAVCNHIGLAIRAFVRLEWHRFRTGISWFEAKGQIIREAVRAYLAKPTICLPHTATA